jgi:hypothetical protein
MSSSNSSRRIDEEGNTITSSPCQISPAKRWCFTLNNYLEEEHSSIVLQFQSVANLWVIGDETGENNTPHLQGYVEFKKKVRPLGMFETKRIHWEKCKGTREQNVEYCTKQKVLSSHGLPEKLETIIEFYPWQAECLSIFNTEPDHRSIHWFYSKQGCTGKTEMVRYFNIKYNIPFSYGGTCSDIMNLAFNNIKSCKAFIFCLTRSKKNHVSYNALEQLKDGLISNNKYETGCFTIKRPHVFVFANEPPEEDEEELYMSKDRFVLHQI